MSYLDAIAALQNIRNALPSLEKVEGLLAAAASAENAVAEAMKKYERLTGDLAALEGALDMGAAALAEIERRKAVGEADLTQHFNDLSKSLLADHEVARSLAAKDHQNAMHVLTAKRDDMSSEIAALKAEKRRLEATLADLSGKLNALKAAAASV